MGLTPGYTGIVDLNGFSFNPTVTGTASCTFAGGTINDTPGTSSITFTTTNFVTFSGTIFNTPLNPTAGRISFNGGTYNNPVACTITGASNVNGTGGCTFNSTLNVTTTGTNYFLMGYTNPDLFNGDATFINNGASRTRIAYGSVGTQFNGNIIVGSTAGTGVWIGELVSSGSTLTATKTVTIGVGGFVSGDLQFRNFTQGGNTTHSLTCTGTSIIYNYDANWGGDVTFIAPRNITRGTLYNRTAYIEKTAAADDQSVGGNTFTMNADFVNSGSGYFLMGNGTLDTYSANVTLNNIGTSHIYFAHNGAGNTIAGDLTTTNFATGTNSGIYIGNGSTSTLSIGGNVSLIQNGSATTQYTYFGDQGDITTNGTLTMLNAGTGTTSDMIIASNTNSSVTIAGATAITNNNTAVTNNRMYIGNQGDITFNGTLDLINNSGSTNSAIYCNNGSNSNNLYNENITVQSTNTSSDGIRFGQNGGFGTLAATKTITIPGVDITNYIGGHLYFRNFTQVGATNQAIELGSTAGYIYHYNSEWNGDLDFRAPRHYTRQTTFNGTSYLEKNGATNDPSYGGNIFNGDVTFKVSGTGYFMPANTVADDYNANTTFIKTGTGPIYPTYNCVSTFAGDITIDANTTIYFGASGNGRTILDGTTAQSINVVGATPTPQFRDLQTLNPNNDITLNTPITVTVELDLDQGHIISTAINLLTINDNASVSSYAENVFVDGPVRKIGNDAFTFPVGKNDTALAEISISAPASTAHHFTAEYFQISADSVLPAPYSRSLKDPTLDHVSGCEYWILDRTLGASNVNVALSWDDRSCGVDSLADLSVARWDGSMWKDHGNGGTTGDTTAGTVTTAAAVTSFSPFTLASVSSLNALPIELISFNAALNHDVVNLTWQTASEINNDYFTLEKSVNAITFTAFAEQPGAGNSNTTLTYKGVDYNPYQGISYYRLKQTDFNGGFEYSKIVTVNNSKEGTITAYPNPIKDILTFTGITNQHNIKVYAANGQIIFNAKTTTINTKNWSTGLYLIIISDRVGKIIEKLKVVK